MARPSPFRRPALLRISESDMCPRITATIAAGSKKKKKPRIRLAIALLSVCCGATDPVGVGGAPGTETALPHTLQKRLPSLRCCHTWGKTQFIPSLDVQNRRGFGSPNCSTHYSPDSFPSIILVPVGIDLLTVCRSRLKRGRRLCLPWHSDFC